MAYGLLKPSSMTRLLGRMTRIVSIGFAAGGLVVGACSSEDDDLFGSHADAGEGGADESGGAVGSGGAAKGGTSAKGGSTGSGSSKATGTGGSKATGTGGSMSSTGGSGGAGGGCVLDGKNYGPGDAVPSGDCNTCSCNSNGQIACTQIACAPGFTSCEQVRDALADELAEIQGCNQADECGQVLEGTSCGCTRNLVARLDANIGRFEELRTTEIDGEPCDQGGASTCDCPAADGFACVNERCSWNYDSQGPSCEETAPGRVCIRGIPQGSGDRLEVGSELELYVTPVNGCRSSSCTRVEVATCAVQAEGERNFVATASFCLADTSSSGNGCTDDCGGGGFAACSSGSTTLTQGEHTLRVGNRSLTFQVPSVLMPEESCIDLTDP